MLKYESNTGKLNITFSRFFGEHNSNKKSYINYIADRRFARQNKVQLSDQ